MIYNPNGFQPTAFPKIFALGSKQTQGLFDGEIEITEKLDGSQIGFGKVNGELYIRSKGQRIYPETVDKMFKTAVDVIQRRFDMGLLPDNTFYYGEYLSKNKHNVLAYDTVPKSYIALYGIYDHTIDEYIGNHEDLKCEAALLGIDVVPLLYKGPMVLQKQGENSLIANLMSTISYLGGQKIEGIVIKNYSQQLLIGGQVIPVLMAKYVSEEFKEVHKTNWNKENTGKGRFEVYKGQFRSPARWAKAVQHLRDRGALEDSPKDIGRLLKEVFQDIESEEKESIKDWLWSEYGKEVLKASIKGLPEWWKKELAKNALDEMANENQKNGFYNEDGN